MEVSAEFSTAKNEKSRGCLNSLRTSVRISLVRLTRVTCELRMTSDTPVYVRPHPLPLTVQEVIEKEVPEMLGLGIMENANSAYNSPLVVFKKPDGSPRIIVDFRRFNEVLVPDVEPIPIFDLLFALVGNKKKTFRI